MKVNPLLDLLPKIKLQKEPVDHEVEAKKKLRQYFKTFDTRRKIKRVIPADPKFTLYLEPFPSLLVYAKEDERIPFKKEYYTSFQVAKRRLMKALREHYKLQAGKTKATLL